MDARLRDTGHETFHHMIFVPRLVSRSPESKNNYMFHFEEGEVILIDKPLDWTSFDTVNFIRSLVNRCYGIRKLRPAGGYIL